MFLKNSQDVPPKSTVVIQEAILNDMLAKNKNKIKNINWVVEIQIDIEKNKLSSIVKKLYNGNSMYFTIIKTK